ncbi:MAG: helix-turn-helix domain-containing protein [Christensenellales bacterium]
MKKSDNVIPKALQSDRQKKNKGKRLLRYTDKPISAIAAYLGFSSQSHSANVFRKYANSSPDEYRLKHNN